MNDKNVIVKRIVENGYQLVEVEKPTVVKEIYFFRFPTLIGKILSMKTEILVWGPEEIDGKLENLGLKDSPTCVVKISTPKVNRDGEFYQPKIEKEIYEVVSRIIEFFEEIK